MRNEFEVAFNEITDLRALPPETVVEALESALVSAYRRDAGSSAAQRVEAKIDLATGRSRIYVEKEVVEEVMSPTTEVELEKARFYDPEAQLFDMVMVQVESSTKSFGRIAAQTAKQVILQKIREAERNAMYEEYVEREGDIVTGTVQSVNPHLVTLSLSRNAEAIMPRNQQIPNERYRTHEKLRTFVLEVKRSNRGPQIVVSRSHKDMLRRLLEYEVPEIFNGQVEIKSIAREAGYRSKVAVFALQEGIDPVGACVGMRGMRIQNVVKELHEEKIDVIEWNPDHKVFIAKALSPARVNGVYLEEDAHGGRTASVLVPDDQLSLAIGREGQNARLAAKLTGWRIDIKSVAEVISSVLDQLDSPALADLQTEHAEALEEAKRILEKREAGRAIMPEEFHTLGTFADLVETRLLAERQAVHDAKRAEIDAVKATLPEGTFRVPISALGLEEDIAKVLMPLENIGEVLWRFLMDDASLQHRLGKLGDETIEVLRARLNEVMAPGIIDAFIAEQDAAEAAEAEAIAAAEQEAAAAVAVEAEAEPTEAEAALTTDETALVTEPEIVPAAVPGRDPIREKAPRKADDRKKERGFDDVAEVGWEEEELSGDKKKKKKKKRQLVYDEETGTMIAKRRRKGSRARDEWDEFLE